MTTNTKLLIFSLALVSAGLYFIILVDWKIAVGLFLLSWGMNIEKIR